MPTLSAIAPVVQRNVLPALAGASFFLFCLVFRVDQFFDRAAPLEFFAGTVMPPSPHIGGTYEIAWDMVPHRQCPGTTFRKIIDAAGYVHLIAAQESLSGYVGTLEERRQWTGRVLVLPATMHLTDANGVAQPARAYTEIHFVCHPWQKYWPIVVHLPVVGFIVQP